MLAMPGQGVNGKILNSAPLRTFGSQPLEDVLSRSYSFFIFMASNPHIFFPSYSITLIIIMLLWELYMNTASFVIRETTGRYGVAVLDTIETRVGHWGRMTGGCGWLARLVLRVLSVVGRTISKGSK